MSVASLVRKVSRLEAFGRERSRQNAPLLDHLREDPEHFSLLRYSLPAAGNSAAQIGRSARR